MKTYKIEAEEKAKRSDGTHYTMWWLTGPRGSEALLKREEDNGLMTLMVGLNTLKPRWVPVTQSLFNQDQVEIG